MSQHLQPIYDVWDGNAEAMAADINELGVTVRQWRNRRDIPSRAWPKIIKAAAVKGRVLRLQDFLPPEVKSDLPPHSLDANAVGDALSATNSAENIRSDDRDGEGGHGRPFHPSCATSSPTNARSRPSRASQVCSADGKADAA